VPRLLQLGSCAHARHVLADLSAALQVVLAVPMKGKPERIRCAALIHAWSEYQYLPSPLPHPRCLLPPPRPVVGDVALPMFHSGSCRAAQPAGCHRGRHKEDVPDQGACVCLCVACVPACLCCVCACLHACMPACLCACLLFCPVCLCACIPAAHVVLCVSKGLLCTCVNVCMVPPSGCRRGCRCSGHHSPRRPLLRGRPAGL
jgi:hypothetical protein